MIPDLFWIRGIEPAGLAILPRPRAGEWLASEMRGLAAAGIDTLVSLLTSDEVRDLGLQDEAAQCERAGLRFRSFPIVDRSVPTSATLLRMLVGELTDEIASGRKVGIHCRMGIGRSGLVAACVMARLGVPRDQLFPMLSKARRLDVPDTPEQVRWVLQYLEIR
ncbi:MAG: protein tyrosine phosphatase [Panacagrimonas sp.]|nr:hypothetical protein [Panacagrimonas sp.]MCC2657497.1 protein tyrosine phosphatase [Panacagrimonas sp.]